MLAALGALVTATAGCAASDEPAASDSASTEVPGADGGVPAEGGRLVDVGDGRSMYLECRGSGSPTVVLVAGLGDRADTWMGAGGDPSGDGSVFGEVAGTTRVCAYDRPGTGTEGESGFEASRSTPVAEPATVADSAADLRRLLQASGEAGPYVLVGHSLGGPIVRLFAGAHPDDVAGLVFVDALSEQVVDGLTPEQVADFEALNDPVVQGRPEGSEQAFYSDAVVPLLRDVPPLPPVPTVILTADEWPFTAEVVAAGQAAGTLSDFVTLEFTDALWAAQVRAQAAFAAANPDALHVTDTAASHYIHVDNPALVVESIDDVVDRVRSGA